MRFRGRLQTAVYTARVEPCYVSAWKEMFGMDDAMMQDVLEGCKMVLEEMWSEGRDPRVPLLILAIGECAAELAGRE